MAPAPRDRFPLDPREGLAGPFDASIEKGWRALEAGDPQRARGEFGRATDGASGRAAAIGSIEALVLSGRADDAAPLCARELGEGSPTLSLWTACGEASAQAGDLTAAFELYQRAAERSPERLGVVRRADELRGQATDALLAEAEGEATQGQRAPARAKVSAGSGLESGKRTGPGSGRGGRVRRRREGRGAAAITGTRSRWAAWTTPPRPGRAISRWKPATSPWP